MVYLGVQMWYPGFVRDWMACWTGAVVVSIDVRVQIQVKGLVMGFE